jgi:hypothetical protein
VTDKKINVGCCNVSIEERKRTVVNSYHGHNQEIYRGIFLFVKEEKQTNKLVLSFYKTDIRIIRMLSRVEEKCGFFFRK